MKKLVSVLVLILLTFTGTIAQHDEQALAILNEMSAKYQAMKGFTSEFTYTLENPVEDISDSFQGVVHISGKKYKLDLGTQQIINDGTTMWTYMSDVKEVNVADYDPEEETLSLANIFDVYKEGYLYLLNPELTTTAINVVDLVPEDHENEFFKIRMFIRSDNALLNRFQIFEKSGNRYVYSIDKFAEQASFKPGTFNFDEAAHPDVEVIDFR